MAIDPRIPMMGEATPFESPFETQRNALALRQAQTQMQEAGEDRMLEMLRKGREVLASSYDEPSYQRGLQTLQRLGIPTNDMPPTFDPRYVENESRALLTAEQQHRQQLFQHDGDVFGVNPFTGQVNELRRGVQAPPPAPKPIEPRLSELVDPKNPMRSLRVDLNTYQGGSLGDPGVYGVSSIREPKAAPVAKTSKSDAGPAKADQARLEGQDLLETQLGELERNYKILENEKAIVRKGGGAVENIGARLGASAVGQFAGGVLGTEAQSARDNIKSARILLLQAIKQATGMSAQQMNSNVELQQWLEAVTDPKRSLETNRGIIANIRDFTQKRGAAPAAGGAPAPAAAGQGLTPEEQAELDQLRSRFGRK